MTISLNALPLAHGNNVRTARAMLATALETGQEFSNGNKTLQGAPGRSATLGRLPEEFHSAARAATYTVTSYRTPIAFRNLNGTWTVPNVSYSATTARHQGHIRVALPAYTA